MGALLAALAVTAFVLWRTAGLNRPAGGPDPSMTKVPPAAIGEAPPAASSRPPWRPARAPAVQLAKPSVLQSATATLPGALEGLVVDAETDARIARAVLTFS